MDTPLDRSASDSPPDSPLSEKPRRVTFDYIKSNHFRVIHANGAWGGLTILGEIHMALYSERNAIPQQAVYELGSESGLGPEIEAERVQRPAIVREVEVSVMMSVDLARSLITWLQDKVEAHDRAVKQPEEATVIT